MYAPAFAGSPPSAPALLPPAIVDEVGTASPWDGGPGRDAINETPAVAAAALHPVLLELLEAYIGSPIHLGHTPTATALPPGNGSTGWHSVSAAARDLFL